MELVDIIYRREQNGMVLRFLADKPEGIALDECACLNSEIDKLLESADIIPDKYILEVSSPGLDRPLKTRRDFERVLGKKIYLHTYEPVNNKRDYKGEVTSVDDEKVTVNETRIPLDKISKARLQIEFNKE